MNEISYYEIMDNDSLEHESCPFQWDCENCYKKLCLSIVSVADFPSIYGEFRLIAYINNKDGKDHIALVKGDVINQENVLDVINQENVLTRLHSSCVTGDALGSKRCDCGPQLQSSIAGIEKEGLGMLIYMQQEGRGIGLTNKIRTYKLQDEGLDTYDANVHLGFKPDERDYEISAAMIKKFGIKSIRLLSNNPEKISQLEKFGIRIEERLPLETPANIHNIGYLKTKKDRFHHNLKLE
jgi:3,4-dihydroxy 2-butanone 4-phosphate synthase/GTP cyclohydrolase II